MLCFPRKKKVRVLFVQPSYTVMLIVSLETDLETYPFPLSNDQGIATRNAHAGPPNVSSLFEKDMLESQDGSR